MSEAKDRGDGSVEDRAQSQETDHTENPRFTEALTDVIILDSSSNNPRRFRQLAEEMRVKAQDPLYRDVLVRLVSSPGFHVDYVDSD